MSARTIVIGAGDYVVYRTHHCDVYSAGTEVPSHQVKYLVKAEYLKKFDAALDEAVPDSQGTLELESFIQSEPSDRVYVPVTDWLEELFDAVISANGLRRYSAGLYYYMFGRERRTESNFLRFVAVFVLFLSMFMLLVAESAISGISADASYVGDIVFYGCLGILLLLFVVVLSLFELLTRRSKSQT